MFKLVSDIQYTEYLSHHGIHGMKWGVHNGPPYPINKAIAAKNKREIRGKSIVTRVLKLSGAVAVLTIIGSAGSSNSELSLENLYNYAKVSSSKNLKLSKQEYAHVLSEVSTHVTEPQKSMRYFKKAIGNYMYTFKNNFDGTYDPIRRTKLTK